MSELTDFSSLTLNPALNKALEKMGFKTPTPIQAQAIPLALEGKDILGCAHTGTGKTGAFAIPLVAQLMKNKRQTALVLVPTRELAAQVSKVLADLIAYYPDLRGVELTGGVPMGPQFRGLARRPRIIVATPGLLIDHVERRSVDLSNVGTLVLDEADRMLDMGFAPQLEVILELVPQERQTMFFTATLPTNIVKVAQKFLKDPAMIKVMGPKMEAPKIEQKVREVRFDEKNQVLVEELEAREGTVLVFVKTKHRTDWLFEYLEKRGMSVERIHGDRTQGQRNHALMSLRKKRVRILVATDVAARGIDVDHIEHVINYDLPMVPEDYIHRIGRTGRAGKEGRALSLVSPEDRYAWRAIQGMLRKAEGGPKSEAPRGARPAGRPAGPGNRRPAGAGAASAGRRPFRR